MTDVPTHAAIQALVAGALLAFSCVLSRFSQRFGLPVSLVFLSIGMLAGSDGFGGVFFDNYLLAYELGTLALVAILFSGGLNTPLAGIRTALGPAATLATVGVVGVALLAAVGARLLGLEWREALLIGAIVSSTDAAAVFAVLHGLNLRRRVALTIELESGLNDPMAVILTVMMTANLIAPGEFSVAYMLSSIARQLALGAVAGVLCGLAARWMLVNIPPLTLGLHPVLSLGAALVAYGAPTYVGGSGFLSVYLAGIVLGNGHVPYRLNLLRVHESLAWLAQVAMFLMLGLLIFPGKLPAVALPGTLLALFLAFVARPAVVAVCLLPFRFAWREIACVAWTGLRGAVPIIIATVPVLAARQQARADLEALNAFDMVFFVVVIGALLPGTSVRWAAEKLGLLERSPPAPPAMIEINSSLPIHGVQMTFTISRRSPLVGRALRTLKMPDGASVMLLIRGTIMLPARGDTRLAAGDHLFVFCVPEQQAAVQSILGAPDDETVT